MACRATGALAVGLAIACLTPAAMAQQVENSPRPGGAPAASPPAIQLPPNTTIVPRSPGDARPVTAPTGMGQLSLSALLTEDGQNIDQGLVWRVYRLRPAPERAALVSTHRDANPTLKLEPGTYLINVAFGRAHLTRKIAVAADQPAQERFVLNAGGLRVTPVLSKGEAISDRVVTYDILSDERDQYGQRTKVASGVRVGVIVRLNAGIYSIVSTYGDANAIARADVTVEAGKLTEATLNHAAARVTFKLVTHPGGDAIADTQWNVTTLRGEPVKESVGALPTHILAPGRYSVFAKHSGQQFRRDFAVRAGDAVQVEVVIP
jgi:hypothetical protein